jgi:arginase family enzyme
LPVFTLMEIRSRIGKSIFPKVRMALALAISIMADVLDYAAAPLLGMPIIGDIFDLVVMSMLYSITKSKVSFIMNLAEFIPLVDFLPVYTASTIIWILRESGYDGLFIARRLLRLLSSTQSNV